MSSNKPITDYVKQILEFDQDLHNIHALIEKMTLNSIPSYETK
jgi:hypothetical protein